METPQEDGIRWYLSSSNSMAWCVAGKPEELEEEFWMTHDKRHDHSDDWA